MTAVEQLVHEATPVSATPPVGVPPAVHEMQVALRRVYPEAHDVTVMTVPASVQAPALATFPVYPVVAAEHEIQTPAAGVGAYPIPHPEAAQVVAL